MKLAIKGAVTGWVLTHLAWLCPLKNEPQCQGVCEIAPKRYHLYCACIVVVPYWKELLLSMLEKTVAICALRTTIFDASISRNEFSLLYQHTSTTKL